ncbi:MAG: nuclear transport factor 2 family protein, partial [Bacteroidales bacterium]|nr:nuclear transport factor 2 family protein [Bacteroidales bacterium]
DYFSSDNYQEQQEIESFVSDWEKTWESKDINKYKELLDKDYIYYDKNGKKINYQDKIKRIKYTFDKYEYIEIDVLNIKIEKNLDTPNYINVTFSQRYESNKFKETGIKTLRLYRSNGIETQWKIFREYFEESE